MRRQLCILQQHISGYELPARQQPCNKHYILERPLTQKHNFIYKGIIFMWDKFKVNNECERSLDEGIPSISLLCFTLYFYMHCKTTNMKLSLFPSFQDNGDLPLLNIVNTLSFFPWLFSAKLLQIQNNMAIKDLPKNI